MGHAGTGNFLQQKSPLLLLRLLVGALNSGVARVSVGESSVAGQACRVFLGVEDLPSSCPEISSDREVCPSAGRRCHGNRCSSPERGGGWARVDQADGSPLMMTSSLRR